MSFFGSFFGNDQRKDIDRGFDYSTQQIGQAQNNVKQYSQQADALWQPYAQRGEQASQTYADSLGLNGTQGGQNALSAYQAGRNPYLSFEQDQSQKAMDRTANARGALNSGMTAAANALARQKLGYQDYSGWQDRLNGLGQQGMQATGQRSNIAMQTGNALADLNQTQAANGIQYSNALASSRNIGVNNLMGIAGLGLRGYGAMQGAGGTTRPAYSAAWPATVNRA